MSLITVSSASFSSISDIDFRFGIQHIKLCKLLPSFILKRDLSRQDNQISCCSFRSQNAPKTLRRKWEFLATVLSIWAYIIIKFQHLDCFQRKRKTTFKRLKVLVFLNKQLKNSFLGSQNGGKFPQPLGFADSTLRDKSTIYVQFKAPSP